MFRKHFTYNLAGLIGMLLLASCGAGENSGNKCPQSLIDGSKAVDSKAEKFAKMPMRTNEEKKAAINAIEEIGEACTKLIEDHKTHNGCRFDETRKWDMNGDQSDCTKINNQAKILKGSGL